MKDLALPKTVLAIDTALGGCAVAVCGPNTKPAFRQVETQRDQAAILIPLIQEILAAASLTFADLDLIVTTVGPGSFTGLRLGLSTARALGLSLSVPIQGVTTMEAMAATYINAEDSAVSTPFFVVLETKREDFYGQLFDGAGTALTDPVATDGGTLAQTLSAVPEKIALVGDATARFFETMSETQKQSVSFCKNYTLNDPVSLAWVGLALYEEALKSGEATSDQYGASASLPLYLRGADVSLSKKTVRIIEKIIE